MEGKNICVVGGAGYVGLITGLCLSQIGHNVINVDVDHNRISLLRSGVSPIYEQGIDDLLKDNLGAGRICFSSNLGPALESSDVIFLAVGTPALDSGKPDISQIIKVAKQLSGCLRSYKLIIVKSTVPLDALEILLDILGEVGNEGQDFDVVINPEFLREGKGIQDFISPDRIVWGVESARAVQMLREIYEPIISGSSIATFGPDGNTQSRAIPVIETNRPSAQIIKYASNAFLATRISFINELADLCEEVGVDIGDVALGIGYDRRIGHEYLSPGLGFGGPCLEKDLLGLIGLTDNYANRSQLLRSVLQRNDSQVPELINKARNFIGGSFRQKTVAVFGLAFKAETSDVRNSPALKTITLLKHEGAKIHVYDPVAVLDHDDQSDLISCFKDPYEAVYQADVLMILTEWAQFRELDYSYIKQQMSSYNIVDGRNLLEPEVLKKLGFSYVGVGRS